MGNTHAPSTADSPITCEAFVLEAAGFDDHAKVTIWAHEPYHKEMQVIIPAALGGTDPSIDWHNLSQHPSATDARFTLNDQNVVTGWAVGDLNFYNQKDVAAELKGIVEGLRTPIDVTVDLSEPDYSQPIEARGGTKFNFADVRSKGEPLSSDPSAPINPTMFDWFKG